MSLFAINGAYPELNRVKNQNGFILITVMLFLLVTTLLITSSLETNGLQMRMAEQQHQNLILFTAAQKVLLNEERKLNNSQKEVLANITKISPIEINFKSDDFWGRFGHKIAVDPVELIYIIEDWGEDDCIQLKKASSIGVKFVRITVRAKHGYHRVMVQSYLALPLSQPLHDQKKCSQIKILSQNRRAWHILLS